MGFVRRIYDEYQVWRLEMQFPDQTRGRDVAGDIRAQRENIQHIIEAYIAGKLDPQRIKYATALCISALSPFDRFSLWLSGSVSRKLNESG